MTEAKFKGLCAMAEIAGLTDRTGLSAEEIVNICHQEELRIANAEQKGMTPDDTTRNIQFQPELTVLSKTP